MRVVIMLGSIVPGERLRRLELVGAALIIAGVVLVNARVGQRPRRSAVASADA
jgi:drug/metabolite transporter (DMT)-like permease